MKVIDLLNKIADGEEVPKKLLYDHEGFVFDNDCRDYMGNLSRNWLFDDYSISQIINDEVKVIEEGKKIENIKDLNADYYDKHKTYDCVQNEEIVLDILTLKHKINEIIDKANEGE